MYSGAAIFDTHVHSQFSSDGFESVADIACAAYELELCAVAITDHHEIYNSAPETDIVKNATDYHGAKTIFDVKREFDGKIDILAGIEFGSITCNTALSAELINNCNFDFVLASIHGFEGEPEFWEKDYTVIDYNELLYKYFTELSVLAKTGLYDSLAHLDYPTRYIRHAGMKYNISDYFDIIDDTLLILAQNGKALEINSSGLSDDRLKSPLPCLEIINRFKEKGGELITFGSDAHHIKDIASNFDTVAQIASNAGFDYMCYYKERNPVSVKI